MNLKKDESGFTLTEALVGLMVISLSLAGLLQATKIVSHLNHAVLAQKQSSKLAASFQADLAARLTPLQPILASDLIGTSHELHFACASSEKGTGTHNCWTKAPFGSLAYVSDGKVYSAWPPLKTAPPSELATGEPTRLEAVLWHDGSGKNIGIVKLAVEQDKDCQFDMISRSCRTELPTP